MDEHRVTGVARNANGKVEEDLGRVTGDPKIQARGIIDQAQGAAENLYGQAKMLRAARPKVRERPRPRWKIPFAIP